MPGRPRPRTSKNTKCTYRLTRIQQFLKGMEKERSTNSTLFDEIHVNFRSTSEKKKVGFTRNKKNDEEE